jgi:hypothetical protein
VTRMIIFLSYVFATICLACLVMIGYVLTWCYRRTGWPPAEEAINCWAFSIAKWLGSGPVSSYLVISMSRHAPVPHVRFAPSIDELLVMELKPLNPRKGWRGVLDSFMFKGRVRVGKGEERK